MLPSVLQPPQTTLKKEKLIHNSCPFQVRILERTAATNVYPKLAFAGMTNLIHSCLTFMELEGLVLDSPLYEKDQWPSFYRLVTVAIQEEIISYSVFKVD